MTYPWLVSIILACAGTVIFYIGIRYLNTHELKSKLLHKAWLNGKKYYEWMLSHTWFFVLFFFFLMFVHYLDNYFFN